MIDFTRSRQIKMHCGYCNIDQEITVPYGCYIILSEGCYAEILEEIMGKSDRWIQDVVCEKCGCCGKLKLVE